MSSRDGECIKDACKVRGRGWGAKKKALIMRVQDSFLKLQDSWTRKKL